MIFVLFLFFASIYYCNYYDECYYYYYCCYTKITETILLASLLYLPKRLFVLALLPLQVPSVMWLISNHHHQLLLPLVVLLLFFNLVFLPSHVLYIWLPN